MKLCTGSRQSAFQHFQHAGVVHKSQPLAEKLLAVDLGGCWERDGHISLEVWLRILVTGSTPMHTWVLEWTQWVVKNKKEHEIWRWMS